MSEFLPRMSTTMDSSGQKEPMNVDGSIEAIRLVEAIGSGQVQLEAEFVTRYREGVRRILEPVSYTHLTLPTSDLV